MKKFSIALICFAVLYFPISEKANADEYLSFSQITCIPEADYFKVEPVSFAQEAIKDPDLYRRAELLAEKYNLLIHSNPETTKNSIRQECRLKKHTIFLDIAFDYFQRSPCAGTLKGVINLRIDDKLVINGLDGYDNCRWPHEEKGITSISYHLGKLSICGGNKMEKFEGLDVSRITKCKSYTPFATKGSGVLKEPVTDKNFSFRPTISRYKPEPNKGE